jgi:hypothetical protein
MLVSRKNGYCFNYPIDGRFAGSRCNESTIKSFSCWETDKVSGNEKTPDFIFL